jgi:hypothetical protein
MTGRLEGQVQPDIWAIEEKYNLERGDAGQIRIGITIYRYL